MKNFYLIGDSIDQSLSPHIHSCIYKILDINAEYKNKKIDIVDFNIKIADILSDIKSSLIQGINITNPYKIKVISPNMKLSEHAQKINAVNCIYKYENHLIGDNTDWSGFMKSIDYNKINLENYDIKIIGAGGAARAIIYSLQKIGIKNFTIHNRTRKDIVIDGDSHTTLDIDEFQNSISKNICLINCIKTDIINDILEGKNLDSIKLFYDLNYNQSYFHDILREKDIKVILGLDMLIYQAIKSIEIWLRYEFIDKIDIEEIKLYLKKKSLC